VFARAIGTSIATPGFWLSGNCLPEYFFSLALAAWMKPLVNHVIDAGWIHIEVCCDSIVELAAVPPHPNLNRFIKGQSVTRGPKGVH
jgi:hypothetical protein